jgi:phosphoglycerate dehydrogenase-like enzyme
MPVLTILDDYQNVALECADWAPVQARYDIEVVDEHISDEQELVRRLAGSEVIIAMRERTPFPARVLDRLPALRLLVTTGIRNAAIDVAAARERGVSVCGTGGSTNSVPELTLGLMLALGRHLVAEDAAIRAGRWQHTVGIELAGATLGIVGLGRLGIPVARLAQAFGMVVTAWSPNLRAERAAEHGVRAVDKRTLFAESDFITVHMPLSDRSRGLIGADELAVMKRTAFLINTSRGPIVDEAALVDALRARRIAGAGLDVFDTEPLPADHPLRSLPNTLVLPHIGYVTWDTYRQWYGRVVEAVLAWADGAPVGVLD